MDVHGEAKMTEVRVSMLLLCLTAALLPAPSFASEGAGPRRERQKTIRRKRETTKTKATRAPADAQSLAGALKARGLKVEPAGEVTQPFFSVEGRAFDVEGDNVQVFRYPTEAAAKRDSAGISPDGSGSATSMASWVGTPHFYRKGRLIVLHVGDDIKVSAALRTLLGAQFAGR
jgi:hypothetical protein